MNINKKRAGIATGVLAAVTMLIAPAAFAANTLSVDGTTSPVGDVAVSGVNKGTLNFETDYAVPADCTTAAVTGTVRRGVSVTSGTTIGKISNLTFTNCTATALKYGVIIEKNTNVGKPAVWDIVAEETPAKNQRYVDVSIRNISVKMHSTGSGAWVCSLKAEADSAPAVFDQVTQEIAIDTRVSYPFEITAYDGSNTTDRKVALPSPLDDPLADGTCVNQIYTDDRADMWGTFTLDTPGVGGIHF